MAIYHLHARVGSRGNGASAGEKASYNLREGQYARQRGELVFAEFGNMPSWSTKNQMSYWEAADRHERGNATLFREVEFALPVELDPLARQSLARNFARTTAGAMPYSLALHGNEGNPHAHLLLSERVNDGLDRTPEEWFKRAANADRDPATGGAKKARLGQSREWLTATREAWAAMCNQVLAQAGHAARIDHRSLADQGVDRLPQIHLGPNVSAMEKKGIETNRGDRWLEVQSANEELQKLREVKKHIRDLLEPKMVISAKAPAKKEEKRVLTDAQRQEVDDIVNCYCIESEAELQYAEEHGCGYLQDEYRHDKELMVLMQEEIRLQLQAAREHMRLAEAEERQDWEQEQGMGTKFRM